VKLLLENGAQPDFKDESGQTPLSRAVEGRNVAVVQLLLAKKVEINFKYLVSERHPHLNESTRLMADTVILAFCSVM
jgi:ankyrin repeat protein